jgi:uncharacterized protein
MASATQLQQYGPWALVTGASSGIGAQFAEQLAAAGLNVILVARREQQLQTLQRELMQRHNVAIEVVVQDLGAPDAADRVLAAVVQRDIGLVVSNAGFGLKGAFNQHARAVVDAMLNVNVRTPLLLLHTLLPQLRARPRAGIILTGSIEGEAAFPWSSAYAATKAFVHSFGLSLYGELEGSGVDLLVLEPGSTDTEAASLQGITRENLVGVMPPAEVAQQALARLGQQPLHIPGWHNRAFVGLLRALPRRWAIRLAGKGMATTLARSGNPIKI